MAVPKHLVRIDFDRDLDFNDANEDVTADVRNTGVFSYKIVRGKNLLKQRAEAAILELYLNNEDHRYSPFNPASPLNDPVTNTSVFPAPDIWFMAGYPVDDFNITQYAAAVLDDTPVGYWRFGESSGIAVDATANGNDGTVTGATQGATGLLTADSDTAYGFDGASGDVDMGSPAVLDDIFAGGGSVEAWINAASDGEGSIARIFEKLNWRLQIRNELAGAADIQFKHNFSGISGRWTTTSALILNTTYHVVITYDRDNVANNPIFYINGAAVPITEDTTPTGIASSDAADNLLIGNMPADNRTFDGTIDEPALYNSILTPAQVLDHYQLGSGVLTGRKPSHDSDANAWEGDTGSFNILSNKLRTASAANLTAVIDFGESDCFVGVKFTRQGSNSGLVLRWSDASNYILIRSDGVTLTISKVVAGVMSTIATGEWRWTAGDEKWLLAELHGDTIRAMVDDQLVVASATDSFNNTATRHGVGGRATNTGDRWDDFGGWRSLFKGRIDTITPRPEVNNQYTYIRALDDMEILGVHQVYRTAPTAPATAGDILDEILDAADIVSGAVWSDNRYKWRPAVGDEGWWRWSAGNNRILDPGTTLSHNAQHQAAMGRVALVEAYQVQDDDVGFFYIDGHAIQRYEASDHRESAPHTLVKKTWNTQAQTGDQTDIVIAQRFEWDDGKDRVENEVWYFYSKISTVSAGVEVWRLNDTTAITDDRPTLNNGETRSFLAVGDGDVIAAPVTPVATTDFTVNTLKDGTGSDLSASVTATVIAGFDGNFLLIELTNNSGSNGFVTFLRLRATKHEASAKAGARAENTQSQRDQGRRRIEHQSLHIDEFDTALDRAEERINQRAKPKERVIVDLNNGTRAQLMQQLHRSISDKIEVSFDSLSVKNRFHIEKHTIVGRSGGLLINSTYELQEAFGGGWSYHKWQPVITNEAAFQWA